MLVRSTELLSLEEYISTKLTLNNSKDLVLNRAEFGSIFVVMFMRMKKEVFLVYVYIDEGMVLTLIPTRLGSVVMSGFHVCF